jgi:hypothetical protein
VEHRINSGFVLFAKIYHSSAFKLPNNASTLSEAGAADSLGEAKRRSLCFVLEYFCDCESQSRRKSRIVGECVCLTDIPEDHFDTLVTRLSHDPAIGLARSNGACHEPGSERVA